MSIFYGDILSSVTLGNAVVGSPQWRFFLANLAGDGVTDLSRIASDRMVTPVLNAPLVMEGRVPSDNPQVWITDAGDGDPYLAEGTRLMWGFRRESNVAPYYVVRAATLVQLVGDEAQQDDARTHFVGYDPWRYLFSRPAVDYLFALPGPNGLKFPGPRTFSNTADAIALELLYNTITDPRGGHTYIDPGLSWGGTGFYTGTQEETAPFYTEENPYVVQQGKSVGQVWQDLTASNECDIVLEPIYDPFNRPNYLVQVSIYTQAGQTRDEEIFAWDAPSRSLVGLSRIQDGASRANRIKFFSSQGGSAPGGQTIPVQSYDASIDKYGNYWAQQFFPGQVKPAAIEYLAQQQLLLRGTGRETVTFTPAPERSPRPFQDYGLGDRVPVWAKKEGFRQGLGGATPAITGASNSNSWFTLLGDLRLMFPPGATFVATDAGANTGDWIVDDSTFVGGSTRVATTVAPANAGAGGLLVIPQYQRIYGFPISISDDALETVTGMLTSPQGFSA